MPWISEDVQIRLLSKRRRMRRLGVLCGQPKVHHERSSQHMRSRYVPLKSLQQSPRHSIRDDAFGHCRGEQATHDRPYDREACRQLVVTDHAEEKVESRLWMFGCFQAGVGDVEETGVPKDGVSCGLMDKGMVQY